MAKQVMDLRPGKGFTYAQSNEHLRIASEGAYKQGRSVNMNPTREHLNFEVTKGGKIIPVNKRRSIPMRIRENLKRRDIKDPNEGKEIPTRRTVANIILQGSREQMLKLAFGDQQIDLSPNADNRGLERQKGIEEWAKEMYNFVAQKFGEENIAAFIAHLDETNPHIHCTLIPVTERNKISYKTVLHAQDKESARTFMLKLHDELAEVNAKYGLERGESVEKTGAKHRTTEQYRQWLSEERERLENKNENLKQSNTSITELIRNKWKLVEQVDRELADREQKLGEQKKELYAVNAEMKRAETRIKGLSTMIANLEARKAAIEEEIANLEHEQENGEITLDELNRRKDELNNEIRRILVDISDKTEKLAKAKEALRDVSHRRHATEEEITTMRRQYDHMQRSLDKAMPDFVRQATLSVKNTLVNIMAEESKKMTPFFEQVREALTPEDRAQWDDFTGGTFLGKMVSGVEDMLATAVTLSVGAYAEALAYAQSKGGGGGGGGGSSSGWGRRKDEDDDGWNRRCLFMGMQMMRPAPGRKLRR